MVSITDGMQAKAGGCLLGDVTSVSVLLSLCFIVLLLVHCGIILDRECETCDESTAINSIDLQAIVVYQEASV